MSITIEIKMRSLSVKNPSASPAHHTLLHLSKAPSTLATCDFKELMHLKRSITEYSDWRGARGAKMFLGETIWRNMADYNAQHCLNILGHVRCCRWIIILRLQFPDQLSQFSSSGNQRIHHLLQRFFGLPGRNKIKGSD